MASSRVHRVDSDETLTTPPRGLMPKGPDAHTRSLSDRSTDASSSVYESYDYNPRDGRTPWDHTEPKDYQRSVSPLPQYPPTYNANYAQNANPSNEPEYPTYSYAGHVPHDSMGRAAPSRSRPSKWKKPWFIYIVSLTQVAVFLGQCGHAWVLTGSPIEIKPSFNVMIGPSVYNSINMGARFQPCMKYIANVTDVITGWPCANATTTAELSLCTLDELCGNGLKSDTTPAQWWRFIVPMFLHAGFIHIAFNLLIQLRTGAEVELRIGSHRLAPIYFAAGIGGFLFGGNFAGVAITSVGASGAIFSIISLELLDLFYHWSQVTRPVSILLQLLVDVIVSLAIGLLPGVDNFSHIGGFIVGLVLGVLLLRSPDSLDRRINPYAKVNGGVPMKHVGGYKQAITDSSSHDRRLGFFEGRKPMWWAFVLLRLICLVLTLIIFILLIKNFYNDTPSECHWCRYLSCLPVFKSCKASYSLTSTVATST